MAMEIGKPAQHIWVLVTIVDGKGVKAFYQNQRSVGDAIEYNANKYKDVRFRVHKYYYNKEEPVSHFTDRFSEMIE